MREKEEERRGRAREIIAKSTWRFEAPGSELAPIRRRGLGLAYYGEERRILPIFSRSRLTVASTVPIRA